jgi:hypothetical protein
MARPTLSDLVRDGRIERVPADLVAARSRVQEAKRHLASADILTGSDPTASYSLLYDAARKAVTAHMLAKGYRAANRPGTHRTVALYAEVTLAAGEAASHIRAFDRMRQVRNRSEYDHQPVTARVLSTDLVHARAIVAAVEASLTASPRRPSPG